EVKQAVWECDSLKSPGLDGVNFGFIKEFWMDVKSDFMRFLLEFYSNSQLVKGSNCTFIVLISKVISNTQFAFVEGRQILDGNLIANEVVDDAKKRKKELLLFKVDFEKAYDSVEWGYLDSVMGNMGFSDKWRRWIMTCVRSDKCRCSTNEFEMG
ncbi:cytochrome P450, partial [Trifolium medium]|nr:cytochrome P450 [Trifolium medium]